jgi:hypothetical protein
VTTANLSQAAVEILRGAQPSLRTSQVAVEVLRSGSAALRTGQAAVEVLRSRADLPSSAWLTQVAIEILRDNGSGASAAKPFLWIVT